MAPKNLLIALIVVLSVRSGDLEVTYSATSEEQNDSSIDALVMMRSGKVHAKSTAIILSSPAGAGFNNRRCRSEGRVILNTVCDKRMLGVGEIVVYWQTEGVCWCVLLLLFWRGGAGWEYDLDSQEY